jgi:hypothetical protein
MCHLCADWRRAPQYFASKRAVLIVASVLDKQRRHSLTKRLDASLEDLQAAALEHNVEFSTKTPRLELVRLLAEDSPDCLCTFVPLWAVGCPLHVLATNKITDRAPASALRARGPPSP